VDAVYNLNKPPGMTSFAVVARARRILQEDKAGHAGTLDPLATGVLLVLTGRATRLSRFLMGRPKEYLATIRLGQETDSCDLEGRVVKELPVPELEASGLEQTLAEFTGDVVQVPPAYSAVKIGGQAAYKRARRGEEVEIPERRVHIDSLELLGYSAPEVTIRVRCSQGTYIRSLARDIGLRLGSCGTLASLCRTAVGGFTLEQSRELESLSAGDGLEMDRALDFLPEISVDERDGLKVSHGNDIALNAPAGLTGYCRVKQGGRLLALGRPAGPNLHPEVVF
jgi:tRNA pseudouridine55 synthase